MTRAELREQAHTARGQTDMHHARLLSRDDRDLPPQLRHDAICDVHRANTGRVFGYRITFEGDRIPMGYRQRLDDDGWQLADAKIRHVESGLRGLFGVTTPRLSILIAMDRPQFNTGERQ